jgi:6,7-dimethyl-8-ribityllumazine synthase
MSRQMKIEKPLPRPSNVTEGKLDAAGNRFGIVVSRFNSFITERLLNSAVDALRRTGAKDEDIDIMRVPGAFEIPSAARTLAETGSVDALICLGCLLRGETSNYEQICAEVTRGIGQSAQETGIPHSFGVLTCDNLEQAIDRAGLKSGNKGFEAAMAAVEMASLKKVVGSQQSGVRRSKPSDLRPQATVPHSKSDVEAGSRNRRKHLRLSDIERTVERSVTKHNSRRKQK